MCLCAALIILVKLERPKLLALTEKQPAHYHKQNKAYKAQRLIRGPGSILEVSDTLVFELNEYSIELNE